jgi:hypothetical protein
MRCLVLILIVAFPPSLLSSDSAPWSVRPAEIVAIALEAFTKRYPEVQPENLKLPNDGYIYCESTRPREHVPALEEEFRPCWGAVEIDLSGTTIESFHLDRDGECVMASPPGGAFISVYEDGSSEIKIIKGQNAPEIPINCTEEVVADLAAAAEKVPGDGNAFSVGAKKILELAFVAAVEEYPEVRPEDWDYEFFLTLFCDVYPHPAGRSTLDLMIKPCVAEVTFFDGSVVVEERRMDDNGRCWVDEAAEGIVVNVYDDGSTRVKDSKGVGNLLPRPVQCTQ